MFAAQHDHLGIVRQLLAAPTDPNARGSHGLTALGFSPGKTVMTVQPLLSSMAGPERRKPDTGPSAKQDAAANREPWAQVMAPRISQPGWPGTGRARPAWTSAPASWLPPAPVRMIAGVVLA